MNARDALAQMRRNTERLLLDAEEATDAPEYRRLASQSNYTECVNALDDYRQRLADVQAIVIDTIQAAERATHVLGHHGIELGR